MCLTISSCPWLVASLSACVKGEDSDVPLWCAREEERELGVGDGLATAGGRWFLLAYGLFELITTLHHPFHISLATI